VNESGETSEFVIKRMQGLYREICDATPADEEIWFRNLLAGLMRSALLDYYSVQVGTKKSVYLAAWGSRNLAELRVTTRYVLASKENANAFRHDFAIDMKEFYEALTRNHCALHKRLVADLSEMTARTPVGPIKEALMKLLDTETKRGAQTQETDSAAAFCKQVIAQFGLKPDTKPRRATELARLIKESDDFDPIFKVCSKIMHRTAMSIASAVSTNSLDEVAPFLSVSAFNDLAAIYIDIDHHVKKRGVRLP
jgi:hypothetical protein